ncbi:LuxR C-terminal-related transcriptional regulator [Leucobacter allii]|uniref:LuxR C-terminal-related transcriptional regulator n=1 Tax=Leucobacter allii TaxID=2932247 RepID=A0ABY4FPB1_9MICO|nr:LuxR C-terminal-related transcriptional regulator [Leucobacter allii]UOQ58071.1 LuxR C-terminal-related transcriptional regulator [Leucobacter allii]UOR02708.1 LuxR C-terminal-related transcriptional regulator [Leucobacter allii]
MTPPATPTAQRSLDDAVAAFARSTGIQVAFGGFESRGVTRVTAARGHVTRGLLDLRVSAGLGLGGKAMLERRPRLTADYEHSPHITHDYDREILGEGIVTLVAFPVVVGGETRAVLYGGSRSAVIAGGVFERSVAAVVERLAGEIRLQDEVDRRVAALRDEDRAARALPAEALEELRESYAELRGIAAAVADPELRARLSAVEHRLAALGAPPAASAAAPAALSPRETDVLSLVALGRANAEIAAALGLTEGTVKGYLKTASAKLGCSGRLAAVSTARRLGLLP